MDEEEATAAAAERIAAAAEDGTSLPVSLATDVVRFLYGGTGQREPADGGVVSASLLNAKPAVGGIGVEPRGGGVLRVLFTVASDAVDDTVVRWRHELRRCVDSTAVFDVLSDREKAQHQALWPAFLAAKVAGKRAQFHRARLVVDGERIADIGHEWSCAIAPKIWRDPDPEGSPQPGMRQRQDQAGPGGLPGALSPRMRDGAGSPHTRGRATPGALLSRALASPVRLLMALLAVLLLAAGAWQFLGRAPGPARDARSRSSMGLAAHLRGAPSPAFCARPRPTLVCAHGGDSTDHPANTAEAFSAAVRGGADCVEVDAARTADGELFVLHVRELKQLLDHAGPRRVYQLLGDALSARHIADSSLQIGDLTYKQVSALHWPGGERVMTVREAVMEAVGVGDGVLAWTRTILTHTYASVEVNGFISAPRKYAAGVRQGCPAAPALFLFLGHALACFLRTCPAALGPVARITGRVQTAELWGAEAPLWANPLLQLELPAAQRSVQWREPTGDAAGHALFSPTDAARWLVDGLARVRDALPGMRTVTDLCVLWAWLAAVDMVFAGLRGLEAAVPTLWRMPLLNARKEPIWRLWPPARSVAVERAEELATMDLWDALASFAEGGGMPRGEPGFVASVHGGHAFVSRAIRAPHVECRQRTDKPTFCRLRGSRLPLSMMGPARAARGLRRRRGLQGGHVLQHQLAAIAEGADDRDGGSDHESYGHGAGGDDEDGAGYGEGSGAAAGGSGGDGGRGGGGGGFDRAAADAAAADAADAADAAAAGGPLDEHAVHAARQAQAHAAQLADEWVGMHLRQEAEAAAALAMGTAALAADSGREERMLERGYTFSAYNAQARLDRFYVSPALVPRVFGCDAGESGGSDHRVVALHLTPLVPEARGPGRPRVRALFWADHDLADGFRAWFGQQAAEAPAHSHAELMRWWQAFKPRLAREARRLDCDLGRRRDAVSVEVTRLRADLKRARTAVEAGRDGLAELAELYALQRRLDVAVQWYALAPPPCVRPGERAAGGMAAAFRKPAAARRVAALRNARGVLVTDGMGMADIMADAVAAVSRPPPPSPADREAVLAAVRTHSPRVPQAVADAAGAPAITPVEVRAAAMHSKPGTAPGPDGIPVDVWRKLGEPAFVLLAAVFTAVGATGETPPGFLDGVVASIYKAKDAADAANYRPLTMLGSDYRILAKVLATRWTPLLAAVVGPEQTAFLAGRRILDNICLTQMLPGLLAANSAEGVGPTGAALALLDFRKAYDTIDRGFLLAVMEAVGVGGGVLAWTRTILTHTYASAEVNEFISAPRQYAAGVRRGCPAAPALFLVLGHELACFLRNCPAVGVEVVPGCRVTCPQYADDCMPLLRSCAPADVAALVEAMAVFGRATGLVLNLGKCGVLPLGSAGAGLLAGAQVAGLRVLDAGVSLGVPVLAGLPPPEGVTGVCRKRLVAAYTKLARFPMSAFGRGHAAAIYGVSRILFRAVHCGMTPEAERLLSRWTAALVDRSVGPDPPAELPRWASSVPGGLVGECMGPAVTAALMPGPLQRMLDGVQALGPVARIPGRVLTAELWGAEAPLWANPLLQLELPAAQRTVDWRKPPGEVAGHALFSAGDATRWREEGLARMRSALPGMRTVADVCALWAWLAAVDMVRSTRTVDHACLVAYASAAPARAPHVLGQLRAALACVAVVLAALPTAWVEAAAGGAALTVLRPLRQFSPLPQEGERAAVVEILRLVGWQLLGIITPAGWRRGRPGLRSTAARPAPQPAAAGGGAAVKATMFHVESITLDVKTYQGEGGLPTDEDAISEQLVRLVHETGCTNCLIWAKSDRVVQTIKALSPGQRTGYIVMNETVAARSERMHEPLRMEGPEVVGMHHGMVDAYHVDLLRRAGKQLHTWTINDPALLRQVLDEGVDALVTNFPRQAIEAIETLLEACGKTGEAYYSL
ncbi:hypothetical protein FOA52_014103 [Chlamydomonas sp. UWO 241]|nr:hypothetical protein FOA52_014103 [Chlamydomonas sp. UWO 241]